MQSHGVECLWGFIKVEPPMFVPDKDFRGRNIVLLQSAVLREMLDITTDNLLLLGCLQSIWPQK